MFVTQFSVRSYEYNLAHRLQHAMQPELSPPVSRYMSLMVLVDRSFRGSPLSPPNSLLWGLCSWSGLPTVVLHTINPSAPPW